MIASLPMYDFPELRDATDELWAAIADRAGALGIDHVPDALTRPEGPLHDHWLDPEILLSHSCGYPVVRMFTDDQHVLGSFAFRAGDPARPGWYRSVIVCRSDDPHADDGLSAFDGAPMVANDDLSLSGYVSLGVALAEAGVAPGSLQFTGAHALSVVAVRDGEADIACIDAHTLALLHAIRPGAVAGLRAIGLGPQVAATPLFTAQAEHVDALRSAVTHAVGLLAGATRDRLQIEGFAPGDRSVHEPVRDLAARARAVLEPFQRR
jgi:ABC-type phosphate/phosphonate transport system substrate-binding protein